MIVYYLFLFLRLIFITDGWKILKMFRDETDLQLIWHLINRFIKYLLLERMFCRYCSFYATRVTARTAPLHLFTFCIPGQGFFILSYTRVWLIFQSLISSDYRKLEAIEKLQCLVLHTKWIECWFYTLNYHGKFEQL